MTPEQKLILEEKKQKLKCEIDFKNFAQANILPFIEILEELTRLEIDYKIIQTCSINEDWQDMLVQLFAKEPFVNYPLSEIPISSENDLVEQLLEIYPNTHPMRYVPDLPLVAKFESDSSAILKSILKTNQLTDEHVYLYYFQYVFLLQINLKTLAEKATEELFNFGLGDAVLFPKDYKWLIAHSIEEEWQFGFKD